MKYNFIEKEKSVTVITPTIGQNFLLKAIDSVNKQTYGNLKHLVVIDGTQFFSKIKDLDVSEFNNLQEVKELKLQLPLSGE